MYSVTMFNDISICLVAQKKWHAALGAQLPLQFESNPTLYRFDSLDGRRYINIEGITILGITLPSVQTSHLLAWDHLGITFDVC
jgi:hypothetical protein